MSATAAEDFCARVTGGPTIVLTVTGDTTRVPPVTNASFSNVPGSNDKLYLEGTELRALYPLSIITRRHRPRYQCGEPRWQAPFRHRPLPHGSARYRTSRQADRAELPRHAGGITRCVIPTC